MKRTESQFAGPVPAAMLTLSVLLCIGALSNGSAAVVAQSLGRHGATADERESVASLLSSLNDAARKLCPSLNGQMAAAVSAWESTVVIEEPSALRDYAWAGFYDARRPILDHLLNLPPPSATI